MSEIGYFNSPMGTLRIVIEEGAVVAITNHVTQAEAAGGSGQGQAAGCAASDTMEVVKAELADYFQGRRQTFDFAVAPRGTEFQQQVWQALLEIPWGQTLSYGQVAERVGRPAASRAVGGAVGANPILIAIPCHRVIRGDGSLGGFSAGLANKVLLHQLEGIVCKK